LPRAKTGADQAYKEFKVANFYDETMKHRYVLCRLPELRGVC
jgi:hypothetical protein